MKKGFNYFFRTCLIIAVAFSCFVSPDIAEAATAETLGDLRREYESLLAELNEYENMTEQAKQEIARKEAAIAQAEKDIT